MRRLLFLGLLLAGCADPVECPPCEEAAEKEAKSDTKAKAKEAKAKEKAKK